MKLLPISTIGLALLCFPITNIGQTISLGAAVKFALFSSSGAVSNTGTSTIIGDVGTDLGSISGFGLPTLCGSIYNADAVTAQAKNDLLSAYINLNSIPVTNSSHAVAFGGGESISAGVYTIGGAGSIDGTLILDGEQNPDAIFIFKFAGAFSVSAGSAVVLANLARINNVFWISEGAISLGASTTIKGTLIANQGAVSKGAGSHFEGHMFSMGGAISFGPGKAVVPFNWNETAGDNLWSNDANWSTGTSPIASNDIVISSGTPRLNVNVEVGKTLTLNGTGTLTIDPGKTLSISTGGVVDFGGKSVTIKSDATGTAQIGRIQGTLSNATNVTVERYIPATGRRYRMLTPSVNTITSIKANWMEGSMNTSGTNVNTIAGYGMQITGSGGNANGFDVTATNAASLYLTTNGVTPGYTSIANTNGTLNALTGYFLFLRGDRSTNMNKFNTNEAPNPVPLPSSATTLRATGSVVQGTVSNFTNQLSTSAGGFSMITNPYPAAISWDSVYAASTNINNFYTYWDPNLGFRGGFTTVTPTVSTPSSLASKTIQSGQAFFVTTTANGTASVIIKESHKVVSGTNNVHGIFKANTTVDGIVSSKVKGITSVWENYQPNLQSTTSTIPEFRMSLYYTESSGYKRLTDGAVALFDNQYTSALDGNDAVDAPNWDENIAITRNGQNLAIESRAALNENDTIAISMSAMKSMNYELQFQGSNFANSLIQPLLIDKYLNTLTTLSLTQSTTVPFTVTSDTATSSKDRFKVVFKTAVVLPFMVTKISAAKKNETVQVDWEVKTDEELKSFDVERSSDGRNFVKLATVASLGKGITLANYSWLDNNPLMGANYYRIKVMPLSGKEKVSPVANITMDKYKPSMEVYPNPTEGNEFNIKLRNLTKGIYQVIITASNGQQVLVKTMEHPGGTVVQRMVFDNDISKGVYRMQVQGEGLSLLSSIIKN